jgi:hypothetical protein
MLTAFALATSSSQRVHVSIQEAKHAREYYPRFVFGEREFLYSLKSFQQPLLQKEHTMPSHLRSEGAVIATDGKCVQLSVVAVVVVLLCSHLTEGGEDGWPMRNYSWR